MKTLHFIFLFLSYISSQPVVAEMKDNEKSSLSPCKPAEMPGTKDRFITPHCPSKSSVLSVTSETRSDETTGLRGSLLQIALTPGAAGNPTDSRHATPITHNPSHMWASGYSSVSQVTWPCDKECSPGSEDPRGPQTGDLEAKRTDGFSAFISMSLNSYSAQSKQYGLKFKNIHEDRYGCCKSKTFDIHTPYYQDTNPTNHYSTNYDHQNIVVLENDPVVMESASFLYEKHPSMSTLLSYHQGALRVIKGSRTHLTRDSHIALVGHGRRNGDGSSMLGGYGAEDVAQVVGAMETVDGCVRRVSLLGCELGKDLSFAARLLRELRSLHIETKLHLHRSALSITSSGEEVTREGGIWGSVWRHKDTSSRVIAWLDREGNLLTRMEGSHRGQVVPNYQGHALHVQPLDWPTHPQMFVPAELRAKYTSIDCLEGLTWSMFFEENDKIRALDFIPHDSHVNYTAVWLQGHEPALDPPIKHITTILDLVREIRYIAKENVNVDLYYILNDCIYKVQKMTLYVSLVGKYMDPNNQDEVLKFMNTFANQKDHLTLRELRQGLRANELNDFCRQTFQFSRCESNCEQWGHYFMAAVFSESVRNFRTFSLFLVSVIACEVSRFHTPDDLVCSAFVGEDHPMVGASTWLERDKRGFYGCSLSTADERTKRDKLEWLEQVLRKENSLFTRANRKMSSIYSDNMELDIFGKVKVINQYAFASFIEYFRGTNEGRKLARGCMINH